MELFFTNKIEGNRATLDPAESLHCTKVMRHAAGQQINFTDGAGGLYLAEILSTKGKETLLQIISCDREYQKRDYYLHMAVAPTKNPDRYEWFIEKAVELGIDEITPLEGDHSQKRVFKRERAERLILSAMKQSLKTRLPILNPMTTADALIRQYGQIQQDLQQDLHKQGWTKLIGHCRESHRESITTLIEQSKKQGDNYPPKILVMIGPEGDFSVAEIEHATRNGFKAFHMGDSRMRTETAALTAVAAVYLGFASV
ncbi:MAG: 16S rRNA (uracil(1498)-N(3))-methyltransferase [Bacteroidetes bacterium HGW-Bacteroidetes-8]|jgi:16S rRNA (uracil1498-N3)-methyltransferase|nr:MAG: 16S rRNA (uracil(1498)-N(3))-methyltransferase [Bacteroidetes bacterium HGW-Bacteroidetes-8]